MPTENLPESGPAKEGQKTHDKTTAANRGDHQAAAGRPERPNAKRALAVYPTASYC